jgi:hypothetical protein
MQGKVGTGKREREKKNADQMKGRDRKQRRLVGRLPRWRWLERGGRTSGWRREKGHGSAEKRSRGSRESA